MHSIVSVNISRYILYIYYGDIIHQRYVPPCVYLRIYTLNVGLVYILTPVFRTPNNDDGGAKLSFCATASSISPSVTKFVITDHVCHDEDPG